LIEKTTKGGIVIARDERSQAINTDQGEVVLIGPECWYDLPVKPDIRHGDKVYYSKYGAKVLKPEENEDFLIILNDTDVLVVFEGKAELEHQDE
jgi:co-chaperonin GroES (HSP10)